MMAMATTGLAVLPAMTKCYLFVNVHLNVVRSLIHNRGTDTQTDSNNKMLNDMIY